MTDPVNLSETFASAHDDADVIPEVAESSSFADSFGEGMSSLGSALKEQASQAVRAMGAASPEMGDQARRVVAKMAEIGEQVSKRELTPDSGEIALNNYIHALQLYGEALSNKAKVESYVRGMRMLETGKKVLFSLLRMGLESAFPGTGAILTGLAAIAAE